MTGLKNDPPTPQKKNPSNFCFCFLCTPSIIQIVNVVQYGGILCLWHWCNQATTCPPQKDLIILEIYSEIGEIFVLEELF